MLQRVLQAFKVAKNLRLILLISLLTLTGIGCVHQTPVKKTPNIHQKVFFHPYDAVWRAAQITLKYPVSINNPENGSLETEWIKQIDGFLAPGSAGPTSTGIRYKISVLMVKGKLDAKESVKLTVFKRMERLRDFFSDPEPLSSDGLEEKALLYRIERELIIEDALKKDSSSRNSS